MNVPNDFDRQLSAWLADGPVGAPDHPVDSAIEHARSHPRRRDPFGFLRSDPMPSRRAAPGFRLAWAGAAVALLVLALVGILVVGGRPSESIVPPPTSSPTASPPASAPTASPVTMTVAVIDDTGGRHEVVITDRSGLLVDAASGQRTPADDPSDTLVVRQDGPSALRLAWINCPRDTGNVLSIDLTGRAFAFERGACAGDTVAVVNVLVLTFSGPIDAAGIEATLTDRPAGG